MNQNVKKYKFIETSLLFIIDVCAVVIAMLLAQVLRFDGSSAVDMLQEGQAAHMTWAMSIMVCLINFVTPGYNGFSKRGFYKEVIRIVKNAIMLFVFSGFYLYAIKMEGFSRLALGYCVIIFGLVDYTFRLGLKIYMKQSFRKGKHSEKFFVVTTSQELPRVLRHVKRDSAWSYEIIGYSLVDEDHVGETIRHAEIIANKENTIEVARQLAVDAVLIDIPGGDREELAGMVSEFLTMGAVCHTCLEYLDVDSAHTSVGKFAKFPVASYSMQAFPYKSYMIKRVCDVCIGLIGSIGTLLVTPFVALAIKLDSPGPVFFAQERIGKNGRRFKMYKYRSMYIDAEERKKELMSQNEVSSDLMFKMENDPRITKVGKFIRDTSIDELPQFFNILKGDMSLVGTRPPTVGEFEKYNPYYKRRLSAVPGLTGMWQVSGRSDIKDFDEVVRLDLQYIDNWSLSEDVKIVLQTVLVVLGKKGSR